MSSSSCRSVQEAEPRRVLSRGRSGPSSASQGERGRRRSEAACPPSLCLQPGRLGSTTRPARRVRRRLRRGTDVRAPWHASTSRGQRLRAPEQEPDRPRPAAQRSSHDARAPHSPGGPCAPRRPGVRGRSCPTMVLKIACIHGLVRSATTEDGVTFARAQAAASSGSASSFSSHEEPPRS